MSTPSRLQPHRYNVKRSRTDETRIRLISATDVIVAIGLVGMAVVSWCLPEKFWKSIAGLAAPLAASLALQTRENVQRIRSIVGDRPSLPSARDIQLDSMRYYIVGNLQVLKDYLPGGWTPEIRLHGVEHIERGLREGRGVILWVANFNAYSLVAKMALFRVGYDVSHLSLWRHGYSDTRFGVRFLNPIRTRIEERYVRERVVIEPGNGKSALMTLRKRLRANGIVSITATSDGKRPAVVPLLDDSIRLAVGAPYLAYETGSMLLPVFPIEEDDGRFTLMIAQPLVNEDACSVQQYLDWATHQYVSLFEPYLLDRPGQWLGWNHL